MLAVTCLYGPRCDCRGMCVVRPLRRPEWPIDGIVVTAFALVVAVLTFSGCGGTAYALRPSKTSDELAAEAHAHCRDLATIRTVLTVAGAAITPIAGGAPALEATLPADDAVDRGIITGAGVGAAAIGGALATAAGAVATSFSQDCATATSNPTTSSGAPAWPARAASSRAP